MTRLSEVKVAPDADVTALKGSLILRKWLFSKKQETAADADEAFVNFAYVLVSACSHCVTSHNTGHCRLCRTSSAGASSPASMQTS